MTDKEKQIEEMAKILDNQLCGNYEDAATALYEAGYRKIDIKCFADDLAAIKEEVRKETAKEIYEQLQGHGTTLVKKWIKEKYSVEVD